MSIIIKSPINYTPINITHTHNDINNNNNNKNIIKINSFAIIKVPKRRGGKCTF